MRADANSVNFFQPAPSQVEQAQSRNLVASASFNVVYIPAGGKDNWGTPCLSFPQEARTAVSYAVQVWQNLLVSTVPIQIQACWASMGAGYLGYGGFNYGSANFPNNLFPDTLAPAALANTLAGSDLNGSSPEIMITINKDQLYSYTTGSTTPAGYYNLATVVLHEMTHGLGFSGAMHIKADTLGYKEEPAYGKMFAYDLFTSDSLYSLLRMYKTKSSELASALTSDAVYFIGANGKAGNNGLPVKLYAPFTWAEGSSYTHLDQMYDGTVNALMTYSLARQETNYDPGPITKGILADIGWKFVPSTLSLSSNIVAENTLPGTTIGVFSTSGGNVPPAGSLTYAFLPGGADNAQFSIVGSTLRTSAALNFETKNAYSISVQATNGTTFSVSQNFTILVTDVNEAPTGVYSVTWIPPNTPAGSEVGRLSAIDPDRNETFTFAITGGADKNVFFLSGNVVTTTTAITRGLGQTYTIEVQATDHGGLSVTDTLVFTVMIPKKVYLPGISR